MCEPAPPAAPSPGSPVRLLVSACLLGDPVRYDGRLKRDAWVADRLGPLVQWERVCPEVGCGLPVPRVAMDLHGDPSAPRLIAQDGADHTPRMQAFVAARLAELAGVELCGYVCKAGSPSSGLERVPVFDAAGAPRAQGAGLFTAAFRARFPLVPVEDERGLADPGRRAAFLERVACRWRWLELVRGGLARGRLVQFHADHKLLLLTHGRPGYTALGRLVAAAGGLSERELFARYEQGLAAALQTPATVGRVTDVLQHAQGYFKHLLDATGKAALVEAIAAYRDGRAPQDVPLTLLSEHARRHRVDWLLRQVFLDPHPLERMGR